MRYHVLFQKFISKLWGPLAVLGLLTSHVLAAGTQPSSSAHSGQSKSSLKPGIILDINGKTDQSFGQAAYEGIERFKKDTGIEYVDFEIATQAQIEQGIGKLIEKGANLVIAVGYNFAQPIEKAAKSHPDIRFIIVDSEVKLPNVQSLAFREEEGSFLVGMMAAYNSKNKKIGFIGGQDIPLIRKFGTGFRQGAQYVNDKVTVIENIVGTDEKVWSDPGKGKELAMSQYDRGADVIYVAAGGTGKGVYQAASEADRFAIAVDSNQNHLYPGTILTSMVKRVDNAIYQALQNAAAGQFKSGTVSYGLKEDGVGYVVDQHNQTLLTKETIDAVEKAKKDIISGKIKIELETNAKQ